jgi:hypothetical protein
MDEDDFLLLGCPNRDWGGRKPTISGGGEASTLLNATKDGECDDLSSATHLIWLGDLLRAADN